LGPSLQRSGIRACTGVRPSWSCGRPEVPRNTVILFFRDEKGVRQMTRADLTQQLNQAIEMPRRESDIVVCAIFDSIVRALRSGDKVEIRGFGSFRTRQRRGRNGRNPKTGAR